MFGQYGSLLFLATVFAGVVVARPPQKVVKGSLVAAGECPYIVSLRFRGEHFCGGTIISDRHIVTAAHCLIGNITNRYSDITIASGTLTSKGGFTHSIKEIHRHAQHNAGSASSPNDIAIIVLASPMNFGPSQSILQLPTSVPTSGTMALTTGWGLTTPNGRAPATELRKLSVIILQSDMCRSAMSPVGMIYPSQICAWATPGYGPCLGDSGGPLVFNGQLIGIVSYSGPCAVGIPVVYTSVHYYADWIKNIVTRQ